jgi:hypothetical protein
VTLDPSELVSRLDRYRERLHALPGVVGSGVGLRDGEPVVEIFVAGRVEPDLERAIREIADFDFVLVPESEPADAQSPQPPVKE